MQRKLIEQLEIVQEGAHGRVLATPALAAELRQAAANAEDSAMKGKKRDRYSNGVHRVTGIVANCVKYGAWELLKFEDRLSPGVPGASDVGVFTVKGDQFRLYGGYIDSKKSGKTFVCVAMDRSKKKDKADQRKLRESAKLLWPYAAEAKQQIGADRRQK